MNASSEPGGSSTGPYKNVCPSHGVLPEEPQDYIAADLLRREHREDCPHDPVIVEPGKWDSFRRALELKRADPEDPSEEDLERLVEEVQDGGTP